MFGETEIPSDSCPSLFPYHVPHAEQDKSISRNPKIFLLVVVMFFQQLGRLIIFTELLTSLVSADQLDSVSDASSIPSVETSNSIFRSSTLSTETIPANSQPWLSLSSPGHDSEILLSDNIAQKACTQPSKSRKRRRDGAGEGVNLCKPEWFKPEKKDQAVDKTTQDIMSMFDPKKWEQVMRDSMRLKWLNELFLPEDRRKCKYHPFVVHLCCNGPFGDRLLGVQALGDYYAFINDCVSFYPSNYCERPLDMCCMLLSSDTPRPPPPAPYKEDLSPWAPTWDDIGPSLAQGVEPDITGQGIHCIQHSRW